MQRYKRQITVSDLKCFYVSITNIYLTVITKIFILYTSIVAPPESFFCLFCVPLLWCVARDYS